MNSDLANFHLVTWCPHFLLSGPGNECPEVMYVIHLYTERDTMKLLLNILIFHNIKQHFSVF